MGNTHCENVKCAMGNANGKWGMEKDNWEMGNGKCKMKRQK